jgi:plasmid stabilization system protein ParE
MIYQVRLQPAAVEDLDVAYQYAAQNAPSPAARWLEWFQTALQTLEHNPERCPLAPENARSSRILRQYMFGKRPNVFRVFYTIEADTVWILRIRRAQRRTLSAEDLGEYVP